MRVSPASSRHERASALEGALPARPQGASPHRSLRGLSIVDVPGDPGEVADVDTEDDLRRARAADDPSHRSHR
ncbi:MAG: hypothetical protein ACRDQ7_15480 [Haloechinothrix sp.]